MNRRGFSVAMAIGILGMAPFVFASGTLDGKTFSGSIGSKEQTEGKADDFVFQDGQFESTLCETMGYGKGSYTTSMKGDAVQFTAETTNKEGGKMDWKGTVTGDQIEGTVSSAANGNTSEMWFKGTTKKL